MTVLAVGAVAVYGMLTFGVRMAVQLHRTGSSGLVALRDLSGPLQWTGAILFAAAIVLCLAGPVLALTHALTPIDALHGPVADALGILLAGIGILTTVIAQFAMGDAWRIGVDSAERTDLVTDGPFAVVRNPIYAAMIPSFAGIALLVPNVVAIAGAILLFAALELHTRLIEEPYLSHVHGERYRVYAARVGRFLPRIGQLPPDRRR